MGESDPYNFSIKCNGSGDFVKDIIWPISK